MTADAPATFDIPDQMSRSVPDRGLVDLVHGPQGHGLRSLVAVSTLAFVALLVPALGVLTGIIPDVAFVPLLLADLAWFAVAMALSIGRAGLTGAWAARPVLVAGQVVALVLAGLFALGVPVPSVRATLLGVLITTAVAALLRWTAARLFRVRTVLVAPVALVDQGSAPTAAAVIGVAVDGEEQPDAALLAEATVRAVDESQADVVRISGQIPPAVAAEISWALRERGIPVQVDLLDGTVRFSRLRGSADAAGVSMLVAPPQPSFWSRLAKRTMDVLGAGALLVVLSPILLGAALAIKLDDRGPVLFRQVRIGKDGEPFEIFKLRTMAVDADARLQDLLAAQKSSGTPLFKVRDDPRLTRIGGFLRRYSIDELPQLLNVVQGTMSLVGPRPQRAAEVALYTGNDVHRLGVAPGMTGLWQVSGRSNLTWQEARRLDVHYAHNWSITLDLSILLRTVRAVLAKDGAV